MQAAAQLVSSHDMNFGGGQHQPGHSGLELMMYEREPCLAPQVDKRKGQETLQHQQEVYIIKLENRLLAQHKAVQAAAAAEAVQVQTQAAGLPKRRAANRRSQGGAPEKPGKAASLQQGVLQAQAEVGTLAAEGSAGGEQPPSRQHNARQMTARKAAGASTQKGHAETGMQKGRAGGVQEGGSEQQHVVQPAPEDFGELWASDGNTSGNASARERSPRGHRGRQPTPHTPRSRRQSGGSRGSRQSPRTMHFACHPGSLAAEPLVPRQAGSRAASRSGSRSASPGRDLPAHPLFSPRSMGDFAKAVAGGPCPVTGLQTAADL